MRTELLKFFLRLDYRGRSDSGYKRLAGIAVSYLVVNTLLSFNSYRVYEPESFMFVAYTVNFFLVTLIVITDYYELFFTGTGINFLRTLPVSEESYFLPRLVSALIYIASLPLIFSLPQTVFAYAYGIGLSETLLFFFTLVFYSLSSAVLMIFIYSLAVYLTAGKTRFLIFVIQLLFFVFIFMLAGYSSGTVSGREDLLSRGYSVYLPQYYFVKSNTRILYLAVNIIITALLSAGLLFFMRKKYTALAEITAGAGSRKEFRGSLGSILRIFSGAEEYILNGSVQSSAFYLAKHNFIRSAPLRMKLIPLALIPVVVTFVSVFLGLPQTSADGIGYAAGSASVGILSPSVTMILIMISRLLVVNTKVSVEGSDNTQWIYDSLPLKSKTDFLTGINKFLYLYLLLPVFLIVFGAVLYRLSFTDAVLNILYTASFVWALNSVWIRFDKRYPFTVRAGRISTASKYIDIFMVVILGIFFIVSQFLLFENIIFVIISIIIFFLLPAAVNLKSK